VKFTVRNASPNIRAFFLGELGMPTVKNGYEKRLIQLIRQCPTCPWKDRKTQTVPPEGPVYAEIVILGRNPGKDEDWEGRPFVGKGGNGLNRFLSRAKIDRTKIWVTNTAKCFGGHGDPKPDQRVYDSCRHWLFAELCLIRPKLIVVLGADALINLTGWEVDSVLRMQGQVHYFGDTDTKIFILSHPGYWVRNPLWMKEVIFGEIGDFEESMAAKLKNLVEELGIESARLEEDPGLFAELEEEG